MLRLDKYLATLGLVARRDAGKYVKLGNIMVNGELARSSDQKIQYGDIINFQGEDVEVKEHVYIVLNKPSGYISSNIDEFGYDSYRKLLQDCPYVNMLNVSGRLDVDTEGLLLLSSDGDFTHKIISPKRECEKKYYVELIDAISDEAIEMLQKGVDLDDDYHTKSSKVEKLTEKSINIIITEGKFHQVKRMMESVGNKLTYLRRESIGNCTIEGLKLGKRKYIDKNDI